MESASLFRDKPPSEQRKLTVFRAEMIAREEASWRELFAGFDRLKAITYSSGLDLILELTGMFRDVEVTFGSERILSREHAALEQASNVAKGYTFVDAVTDQKAFLERLAVELGKSARALLPRVANGTLRFRLLRKMPSHEKLYMLAAEGGYRVITGSANLSLAALCGRQKELYVIFEGEQAYRAFDEYYARDAGEAAPVPADYLAVPSAEGGAPQPRTAPIPATEVPCVAADRGFWSHANKQAAKTAGVKRVCIPAVGKLSVEQRAEQHQRWFRRGPDSGRDARAGSAS